MSAVILFTPVLTISGQAYMIPVLFGDASYFLKTEFSFAPHRDNISHFQIISVGEDILSIDKNLSPFYEGNHTAP